MVLEGCLENGTRRELILEQMEARELIPIDTVTCDQEGKFQFSFHMEEPGFYILRTGNSGYITLFLQPGEQLKLQGLYGDTDHYSITGSPGSEQLMLLGKEHKKAIDILAGLTKKNMELQHEKEFSRLKAEFDRQFDSVTSAFRGYSLDFIDQNQESPIILIALYNLYGHGLPVFDPVQDLHVYRFVDSVLWSRYPDVESVKLLHSQLAQIKKVSPIERKGPGKGEIAPDFVSSDPDGKKRALSDYRGSYLVLGFWASWSHPSRIQNSYLVKAHAKYSGVPVKFLQVSLDEREEDWKAAIKEDGLDWDHLSDLNRWESPLVRLYRLERIPYLMLIDPSGRIVATDLQGEDLDWKLETLIKN